MARLTIVQYAGDYREAVERFAAGGAATYQAQRYSVDSVGSLAAIHEQVAVVCGQTAQPYDAVIGNGVRAVGLGFAGAIDEDRFVAAVAATRPTHLVITTPMMPLLTWAHAQRIPSIAMLADSFEGRVWRTRLYHWRLRRRLNRPGIAWIGNHGLNACLSLTGIGVDSAKIVPWDWPPSFRPDDNPPRSRSPGPLRLMYVGGVAAAKGVGDLIDAVALLRARGSEVGATIYGNDHGGAMAAYAATSGVSDAVMFAGPIPNEAVPAAMRTADAVVIPSRHEYPEGLPLTIYEALSARTPILASDHPMFRGILIDRESAMVFAARDPAAMADAIATLDGDAATYARLSERSLAVWEGLQLPVRWADLIGRWLDGGEAGRQWLAAHSLASGCYDARIAKRGAACKPTR